MDPEKFTAGSSSSAAGDTVSAEVDDAKRALDMASTGSSSPPKPEEKDDQTGVGLEEAATKVAESASKDHGVNLLLDGNNSLVHSLPPLVKALDAVAQVHPFIASAFCLRARALSLVQLAEMVHPNSCRRGVQGCD